MTQAATLFEPEEAPKSEIAETRFDWYAAYCRSRYSLSPDWEVWKWEVINFDKPGAFVMVEGAVCKERFTRGKRRGRLNYKKHEPGTLLKFPILDADLSCFKAEWSASTGKCHTCFGTGQECYGWDHKTGNMYRDCMKCEATGSYRPTAP